MSNNIFVIADLHLGHSGSCKWLNEDGTKIRPFDSAEEMDEALVENWNATVGPNDKTYVLGDVAMKKSAIATIGRCNGKKVLIKGNHDLEKVSLYSQFFYDIRACWVLDKMLLTHIPIHPESLSRWTHNIHGHLHQNRVMREYGHYFDMEGKLQCLKRIDPRYYCISVEHTNYTPIAFEDLKVLIKEQQAQQECL